MSTHDDHIPRIHAVSESDDDVTTVPAGSGSALGEDVADAAVAESELRVTQTDAARAANEGFSPYGGLAADRPDRETLDNSPDDDTVNNRF